MLIKKTLVKMIMLMMAVIAHSLMLLKVLSIVKFNFREAHRLRLTLILFRLLSLTLLNGYKMWINKFMI